MKQTALRQVAVIGVGMSVFGKQTERTFIELATEACRAAIKDAGVNPKDIEGTYCANLQSDFGTQHAVCLGQEVGSKVGVVNGEIINIPIPTLLITRPVIKFLMVVNQRGIIVIMGANNPPIPMPTRAL